MLPARLKQRLPKHFGWPGSFLSLLLLFTHPPARHPPTHLPQPPTHAPTWLVVVESMKRNIEHNDIGHKVTPSVGDARLVMLQVGASLCSCCRRCRLPLCCLQHVLFATCCGRGAARHVPHAPSLNCRHCTLASASVENAGLFDAVDLQAPVPLQCIPNEPSSQFVPLLHLPLQNAGLFDAVDLDPYGSPSILLDSAVQVGAVALTGRR